MAAKASAKSSRKEPVAAAASAPSKRKLAVAPPAPPPVPQLSLEQRVPMLEERLTRADPEFQRAYRENLDMSWIYHDSALEGTVYTSLELKGALDPTPLATDSSIQPVCEEIRRHREALDYIRDYAVKKRQPINIDVVKKIYLILHPEEGDIKTVKYRKDIPQHRLYFHEYAPPDKITYKVRQVLDWVNDGETRRTRSAIRIAARAHYDLLRVFPFTTDSGKVARLFMNLLLLRSGYPPAIVHSTERQRYYEALKGSNATMTQIVHESIENNLSSVEKLLDAHESKGYSVRV
jgi:Fic family protein